MNLAKLSLVGYGGETLGSPVSFQAFDGALDAAGLGAGGVVLDLGCGSGQAATHMARRGAYVVGVERHAIVAEAARARMARAAPGSLEVIVGEAATLGELPAADLVVAMGAGRLGGGAGETLAGLAARAKAGGAVLWGESFWRREPSALLRMVADAAGGLGSNADYLAAGSAAGLELLHARESSREEWDSYVFSYVDALEAYAREHPEDPDAEPMVNRARAWGQLYDAEAREAMGFGLYVWRSPG